MLTEKPAPGRTAGAPTEPASLTCYVRGRYVPLSEASVPLMTHAFLYGTAVFEGIRAYWNEEQGQLYALRVREHVERLRNSAKILLMEDLPSVEELSSIVVETIQRNGFREDAYVRPSFYMSTQAIGVRLHGLEHDLYVVTLPFGDYIDTTSGISVGTVSWRRTTDVAIPARGKVVGAYVNSAFAKTEAQLNGFDEAIVLTTEGHASEGSAENLFMVRGGTLITPAVTEDILEGITRAGVIEMAGDLGIPVVERPIDRTELYVADEIFLCGTGAQISPVTRIDHRTVGDGTVGPLTARIKDRYFDAVRGRLDAYRHWLTPIHELG